MTHLPLELISILNLMRINFFIGQAPQHYINVVFNRAKVEIYLIQNTVIFLNHCTSFVIY